METITARIFARKLDQSYCCKKIRKNIYNCCYISIVYIYDVMIFKQSCQSLAKIADAVTFDQMSAKSCQFFK